ncbi:FtsK/SpoIIIE domain-containing protein [Gottfriedia acidiceleris]|uniref:FtsK/SpoIIIE domain-containing protein n=1 Tax=Gottfriedia acidiceleris TaxID=371036 RepID=UPI002F26DE5C
MFDKFMNSDKKKIKRLFKIANICVKEKDVLKYPVYTRKEVHENYTSYIFTLPLGIPSKLIQKFQEIISESLYKPILVEYNNYLLEIKVFHHEMPTFYDWSPRFLKDNTWEVCMGKSLDDYIYHDFEKTPHMTCGGMTRYGKTVFLKNAITDLTLQQPENVEFYILDLKGGLEYIRLKYLKQVKAIAENPLECLEVLDHIKSQVEERMRVMKANDFTDIRDSSIKKRTFIIVDEGAQLAPDRSMSKEQKSLLGSCQRALEYIAAVSGGLGFRLIFCTQYPTADTLPRQIKQNADAKIGFRLPTQIASQVTMDENGLEELPRLPGRAIYKTDICTELQVPFIDNKKMWEVLEQYEIKETPKGEQMVRNFKHYGSTEVCDKKTTTSDTQITGNKEQPKDTERNDGFRLTIEH